MKKLLILTSFVALACSPAREESKARTFIRSIEPVNQKLDKPYQSPLKNQNASASSRVAVLAQNKEAKGRFRFLHAFETREKKLAGRVEVANNPFIQFALSSERLKRDDPDTFIKQVEDAYEKGEVSTVQWAAFVLARTAYQTTGSTWGLIKFQTKAINQKVSATFPGVLGGVNELDKSLPYLLIRKFSGGVNPANPEIQKTLAASLPLLTSSIDDDMRQSLGAAIHNYPFNQNLSETERVSSFILFQRLFNQLLQLKGYTRVKYGFIKEHSAIPLLTDEKNSFDSTTQPGYFVNPKTGKNVALTSEDIAAYDPAVKPLLLTSSWVKGSALAPLDLELKVMTAAALAFEASSPAAHFVSGPKDYLFGDVTSLQNRAVVPAEAHSLSFGLTVMLLKNLSARRIAIINEQGQDVSVQGGEPAGIAFFDQVAADKKVKIDQVLKLIEFNLHLESALTDVIRKSEVNHDELKAMNSFYEHKAMMGNLVALRQKLIEMRFPLYFLTMKLVKAGREELVWNPQAGFAELPKGKLSDDRKHQVGQSLRDLGTAMDQPLIVDVANQLSGGADL